MMSSASTQRTTRPSKERITKSQVLHPTPKTADGIKSSDSGCKNAKILQPTPEQLRIAQITNATKSDDVDIKSKIEEITRVTGKSSDEAVVALHDCDNDTNRAVNLLIDGAEEEGKWETSCKKKKNRQPSQKPTEMNGHEPGLTEKDEKVVIENTSRKRDTKPRETGRYRGPPRMNRGGSLGRNWRNKENERNDWNSHEGRHERNEGRPRNSRRGRGRGGRSRTFQNRGLHNDGFPESIDTWTNSTAEKADVNACNENTMTVGNWSDIAVTEEWSEEDWTELTETKVFTPSANNQTPVVSSVDSCAVSSVLGQNHFATLLQKASSNTDSPSSLKVNGLSQQQAQQTQSSLLSQQMISPMAQTVQQQPHFDFNQFAKQAAETIKAAVGVVSVQSAQSSSMNANSFQSNAVTYQPNYAVNNANSQHHLQMSRELQQVMVSQAGYTSTTCASQHDVHMSHDMHSMSSQQSVSASSTKPAVSSHSQPQRSKSHKTRLPPPSKIPESAVVMPDDAVSSLDVQFLQFGADSSPFDFASTENNSVYQEIGANSNSSNHVPQSMSSSISSHALSNSLPSSSSISKESSYSVGSLNNVNQTNVTKELAQSQKVSVQENLLPQPEHKSADSLSSYVASRSSQSTSLESTLMNSKSEQSNSVGNYNSSSHESGSFSNVPYGSQKSSVLNTSSLASSSVSYTHPTSLNSSDLQSSLQQQQAKYQSQVSQQDQTASYVTGSNTYGMQSSAYSSSANVNTYPSQSSYSSAGMYCSNNSGYSSQQGYSGSSASSSQVGTSLSTSGSNTKMSSSLPHAVKDSSLMDSQHTSQNSYDVSNVTTVSSVLTPNNLTSTSTVNHNVQSSSSMNAVLGLVSSSASTTSTSVLKNSTSSGKTSVPSIPQSMPMVGHQYIMGQAGLPFYGLQQPVYSYEDMQVLQSKLSTLSYYDMFQQSTSMTGRDPSMGNVAYTAADGKYSRADTDASAVVTTLSQGQTNTQAHSQAFLNPATALPPGYGYYFPGGMMSGSIHHYAPPIFPVPAASNTHAANTNTQYQKAGAYGSHSYASGYDSLTQSQDFAKGTYGSATQSQVKGVSAGSGPVPDLSVYSKTHAQLAKSYDKPGFHTGTPPPFSLAGSQATGPLGASSAPYAPQFIPVLTHGQHHSTLLHHHMQQDGSQSGSAAAAGQRGPQGLGQQKNSSKQNFAYWANN